MTVFQTLYAENAMAPLQELFGETVTYTAPDGTATSLTALVSAEEVREEQGPEGRVRVRTRQATIFVVDLAEVSKRGKVTTADGTVWPIDDLPRVSGTQTVASLVRTESAERSRPEFRRAT